MENQQYLKHKKEFKLNCILKATSSVVAILALIFLIFVPNFKIDLIITEKNFSVYDEMKLSFDSLKGDNMSVTKMLSVYQILAVIYIGVAVVLGVAALVKNILNIINIDNHSLLEYDKIKKGADKKKSLFGKFSASNMLIGGIVLEVMYIILSKTMSGMYKDAGGADELVLSYFSEMSGVSGFIAFFIIFAVGFIGIIAFNAIMYNKLKLSIIKEDYGTDNQKAE